MKRWIFSLLVMVSAALATARAHAALRVVATTPDLAAVATAVGGQRVEVTALALPTQDPHWVDARPHLALDLARADVLIAVGAELEIGWLPNLQKGSRNGKIQSGAPGYVDCSGFVTLLEVSGKRADRAAGDVHPSGNPHYMLDPRAAERVAVGLGKRFAALDPDGRAAYLDNTKRFVAELRSARRRWEERLARARGLEIVTYHKSLSYLADWLGLEVIDQVEPRPGIPPNPGHVSHLIELARKRKLKLVLQESWFSASTSKIVAEKSGAKLVVLPGMPNHPSQTYVAFLDDVVARIGQAL